jgi:cysteinyl-tRNA synthetase
MNDDFNTALTIGHLFNLVKKINAIQTGQLTFSEIGKETFDRMKTTFITFTEEILGLQLEMNVKSEKLIEIILQDYKEAKDSKNYDKVDELRGKLKEYGVVIKDLKSGIDWALEE